MADRYDQMLENYFTGKYPALIQLRIAELNVSNVVDDNVGGSSPARNIRVAVKLVPRSDWH